MITRALLLLGAELLVLALLLAAHTNWTLSFWNADSTPASCRHAG